MLIAENMAFLTLSVCQSIRPVVIEIHIPFSFKLSYTGIRHDMFLYPSHFMKISFLYCFISPGWRCTASGWEGTDIPNVPLWYTFCSIDTHFVPPILFLFHRYSFCSKFHFSFLNFELFSLETYFFFLLFVWGPLRSFFPSKF